MQTLCLFLQGIFQTASFFGAKNIGLVRTKGHAEKTAIQCLTGLGW